MKSLKKCSRLFLRPLVILSVLALNEQTVGASGLHRSLFYGETPFGSLAWVPRVGNRSSAKGRLTVDDLSKQECISLPQTGPQWFMINHRLDEGEGKVGYFAIAILYQFDEFRGLVDQRTGVHLQRNANWIRADGSLDKDGLERDSDRLGLTMTDFTDLHSSEESKAAEKLATLESKVGEWHMKPEKDSASTWANRDLFGPVLKAYSSPSTKAISARLIRFTATASTSSKEPVLFWLDPRGASSAVIRIDAPTVQYEGSRRTYEIKFGSDCTEPTLQ